MLKRIAQGRFDETLREFAEYIGRVSAGFAKAFERRTDPIRLTNGSYSDAVAGSSREFELVGSGERGENGHSARTTLPLA
jgi:hypothetical protein